MHVELYTPAARPAQGKRDTAFRTKPQIALELVEKAGMAGIAFQAFVADCGYGDNNELKIILRERGLPYVLARRSSATGGWAPADVAVSFRQAAQNVPLNCGRAVARRFRDGHAEIWWAAELSLGGYGPGKQGPAVCATTDRNALPEILTWYLTTKKDELGWADFIGPQGSRHSPPLGVRVLRICFCWWHANCHSRVSTATHQPDPVALSSTWRKK